jgi:hypothetical protein
MDYTQVVHQGVAQLQRCARHGGMQKIRGERAQRRALREPLESR